MRLLHAALVALSLVGCGVDDPEPADTGDFDLPEPAGSEPESYDTGLFYLFQIWGDHPNNFQFLDYEPLLVQPDRLSGPMSVIAFDGQLDDPICWWRYDAVSETPATDCEACDFAFKIEHTYRDTPYGAGCDLVEAYYGYSTEYFTPSARWGIEVGGLNFWQLYGYNSDGLMWYQYAGVWYPSNYTYNLFEDATDDDSPDMLYFYEYLNYGYYYRL